VVWQGYTNFSVIGRLVLTLPSFVENFGGQACSPKL